MTDDKISLEVPVDFLNSYTKDQLYTVISSQAILSGYILDGKEVTQQFFDETVKALVSKANGGKAELISIMQSLSKIISGKGTPEIKVDRPSTSRQENDQVNYKFKVLDSSLPKYGGNMGENLEEWLLIIQGYLDIGNYSQVEALLAVLPLLKENALQQFITFRKAHPYDGWRSFVEHLRRVFKPFDVDRRIRVE